MDEAAGKELERLRTREIQFLRAKGLLSMSLLRRSYIGAIPNQVEDPRFAEMVKLFRDLRGGKT
jgi:hypothetical protein